MTGEGDISRVIANLVESDFKGVLAALSSQRITEIAVNRKMTTVLTLAVQQEIFQLAFCTFCQSSGQALRTELLGTDDISAFFYLE